MLSLFQLSTRQYDVEIPLIQKAMADLESKCNIKNGYKIGKPFNRAGWTFVDLEISVEMTKIIEKSGMMEGALGFSISEQIKNFVGHHVESYGSQVRIKKIDYD